MLKNRFFLYLLALSTSSVALSGIDLKAKYHTNQALQDAVPQGVTIGGINWGGSGCNHLDSSIEMAPDSRSFTLLFENYVAEIGPGISRRDRYKFCQVTLDLEIPPGWSYTVADFDYRGLADLDPGVKATQTALYYFDRDRQGAFKTELYGGRDGYYDEYLMSDTIGFDAMVWSRCSETRLLNIKTSIRLSSRSRSAGGMMTVDSMDGKVTQTYGLRWKPCR